MAKQIDGTDFACLTINADLEAENEKLKKQLALTEKALELACKNIFISIDFTELDFLLEKELEQSGNDDRFVEITMQYLIKQAQKEVDDGES